MLQDGQFCLELVFWLLNNKQTKPPTFPCMPNVTLPACAKGLREETDKQTAGLRHPVSASWCSPHLLSQNRFEKYNDVRKTQSLTYNINSSNLTSSVARTKTKTKQKENFKA